MKLDQTETNITQWTIIVDANKPRSIGTVAEILKSRDIIYRIVKRSFQNIYNQTLLGPLWIIINPIITTLIFALVFGYFAKISSDGLPIILFFLTGNIIWNFFSHSLINISNSFISNHYIIRKIYVPILVLPIAEGLSALAKFLLIFTLSCPIFFYYSFYAITNPNIWLVALPFLLVLILLLALGLGMAIAALMVKRRDLSVAIPFLTTSLMFLSPVLYPTSVVPAKYQTLYFLNPLVSIIECFRYAITGVGTFSANSLIYSTLASFSFFFIGLFLVKKNVNEIPDFI